MRDGARRGRRGAGLYPARSRRQHRVRDSRRPPSRGRAGPEEQPTPAPSSRTTACWWRRAPRQPTGFDEMTEARLWLVTGPNMAGKSTFLRQNALITVLAQMGSFVPARSAHIGIVDRLFSRVGAADDLARGRSTFMVEMVETAGILNQATNRSLVILDEIGRGTATFDGLSIAWAVVEHLHEVNALPRPVCHALSRADRACRPPARDRQRHHGRARVARRDRVPAQGESRRRRPRPTASRSRSWRACPSRSPSAPPRCSRCWKRATARPATARPCSTSCRCSRRRGRNRMCPPIRPFPRGRGAGRHQPRRADAQGGARNPLQVERLGA